MAYSIDFRKQAIAFMDEGHTYAELKRVFNLFPSTLDRWRKLADQTGSLEPRPIPGRPPKIDLEALKRDIMRKPNSHLRELAEPFGCSANAVFNAIKRHRISYKKNRCLP